jgi:hypothetical protein
MKVWRAQPISLNAKHFLPMLALVAAAPSPAQFETSLSDPTRQQYRQYVKSVETELRSHWQASSRTALLLDERPEEKAKVRDGEFAVWEVTPSQSSQITDGMVHDWAGAMYLPGAKVAEVVHTLGDWKNQKNFYPEVIESKLISRNGDTAMGFWRLKRTKFVTVVLDVDLASKVTTYPNGLTTVTTHTTRVSEVLNPGEKNEKIQRDGEGHGYLWAFDAFWTLRQDAGGVYAECRTVSLSRTIPPAVAWMVGPLINTMPRESLLTTLRGTRTAISGSN